MTPDEKALREAIAAWHRATEAADPAVTGPLLTPDAVLLTPGRPPVTGREACVAALSPRSFGVVHSAVIEQAVVYGEWGHAWCEVVLSIAAEEGTPEIRVEGHTLALYRKDAAGKWLLAREATMLAPAKA